MDLSGLPLAKTLSDGRGRLTIRIQIPANAQPGDHLITATGEDSGRVAQAAFGVRTNWSEFGFDAANTGHNRYENVLGSGNVGTLQQEWSTELVFQLGVSPGVVDGVVYASTVGDDVYALQATTGEILWQNTDSPGTTAPAVVGQLLVYGSLDGNVYGLNRATGRRRWAFPTGAGVFSSPTMVGGLVYIGSNDGNLYALDAVTGQELWSTHLGGDLGDISSAPAVAGGVVYAPTSYEGDMYALDSATGEILWSRALNGGSIESSPVVAQGNVYIASEGRVLWALDADTGGQVWRQSGIGEIGDATPAVAGGVVYVPSPHGRLYAFDAATGSPLWYSPVDEELVTSVSVANGVVYVGGDGGSLYAFDALGSQLWAADVGPGVGTPAVADGIVYVGTGDNRVLAFGLP